MKGYAWRDPLDGGNTLFRYGTDYCKTILKSGSYDVRKFLYLSHLSFTSPALKPSLKNDT